MHDKACFFRNTRNRACLEVFAFCKGKKLVGILCRNDNSHTLLRLAYCKLGTVKTVILFRNCVEVNFKTVCKLAYRNGYTACTEVIATLNHAACLCVPEQALELALFGSVTLLNLCTAGFKA